ncbi:7126_t:CDS:2, partial [Acaulospora morrowiae]
MDADTLHLIKRLESAIFGRPEISPEDSQLDINQQLSSLKIDEPLELDLPRNIEIIAKDIHNTIEEIRNFIIDLIPLIEPISNAEMDTEDNGKDVRLRAKEFMREWSNLDSDIDNVIDERLKYNNETLDPESPSILENIRRENEQAISRLAETTSRIFDNLFSLGEALNISNRHDLPHKSLPPDFGEHKNSHTPGESIQSKSGADNNKPSSLVETEGAKERIESHNLDEVGEYEQSETFSNPINSPRDDQISEIANSVRRDSFLGNMEDAIEAWDVNVQQGNQVQTRNIFAVGIIRRIKAKLEGRDFDSTTKMTVHEQVDKIIQQATSVDNLCVMYEGWTSWI